MLFPLYEAHETSLDRVPTHPTAPELSGVCWQEMVEVDLPSITLVTCGGAGLGLQASWMPQQDHVQQEDSFIELPFVVRLHGHHWWCC